MITKLTDEELQKLVEEREKYIIILGYTWDQLLEIKVSDDSIDNFWIITRIEIVNRYFELNPDTDWKLNDVYQLDDVFYDVIVFDERQKGVCIHNEKKLNVLFHFSRYGAKTVTIGFNPYLEDTLLDYNLGYTDFWKLNGIKEEEIEIKKYTKETDSLEIHSVLLPNKSLSSTLFDALQPAYIKRDNFLNSYLCLLSRYKTEVTDFYGFPTHKETHMPLNELVEFVEPPNVKPGDILISGYYLNDYIDDDHCYINSEFRIIEKDDVNFISEIYTSKLGQAILRCPEKIRKYICIYLYYRSTIVNEFILFDNIPNCYSLEDIPVFIPEGDLTKFDSIFDDFKAPIKKLKLHNISVKKIDTEQLMNKYMDQFEKCINIEAYTAAMIMAGSVLEAFLSDWVAAEEGDDTIDSLDECINKLQDKYGFENPPWDADTAHLIRKNRNYVHPKKLLKASKEINKDMCYEAYTYLKYIIDYRNKYGKKGKREEEER